MDITYTHLKIDHSQCHFETSLRNDSDEVETARLEYALLDAQGRGKREAVALQVEPRSSCDWDAWLSSSALHLIARFSVNGREFEVRT